MFTGYKRHLATGFRSTWMKTYMAFSFFFYSKAKGIMMIYVLYMQASREGIQVKVADVVIMLKVKVLACYERLASDFGIEDKGGGGKYGH